MTSEEIKNHYSMNDVVAMYGFQPDRKGFIHCPFHQGDKGASLKVYKDSFNCFGCGANGDIFTFVQKMNNCGFKDAFLFLGGEYQKQNKTSLLALYHLKQAKEKKEKEAKELDREIRINNTLIHASRELFKQSEPLSDDWWFYLREFTEADIKDINLQMKKGGKEL